MQLHADKQTPVQFKKRFSDSVKPFLSELKKYCISLTKSTWSGEDLAQEALMKAYMSWTKKQKTISKAYLFKIASNLWIDKNRKRALDVDFLDDVSSLVEPSSVNQHEVEEAMEVLLEKLSLKERMIIVLIEGLRYKTQETATMLEMTEGAVKAALHRARRKLEKVEKSKYVLDKTWDEEATAYAKAFCSGNPASVVELYRGKFQQPHMEMGSSIQGIESVLVNEVSGSHSNYVLVSVPLGNGIRLFVPIFQTELNVLLSWVEELIGQTQHLLASTS